MDFILQFLQKYPLYTKLKEFSKSITIPYYPEVTLYKIARVYLRGIQKTELNTRAAAISWQLFLGIFPYMLFFLMILQYMPQFKIIEDYLYNLILDKIIPPSLIHDTKEYLLLRTQEISANTEKSNAWVIIVSIITYMVFATNGMRSLINGLNSKLAEHYKKRSVVKQYFLAMGFTVFYAILLMISLIILYYTEIIFNIMSEYEILKNQKWVALSDWKELFILLIFFVGLSLLYYKGPKIDFRYRDVLPGTILTTVLFSGMVILFGIYISNFNNYNVLYGSVGTILILMLLLYITVFLVLIGNEVNIVFRVAKLEKIS